MPRRTALVWLLAVSLAIPSLSTFAHAGWTDAAKKQAAKVTKPDKPKAATESGPVQSRMQPAVTAESMTRFQKGMETEIAEREKAKKLLASLPKKEVREKCAAEVAMSADAQKLVMDYAEEASNAKPEDAAKLQMRMSTRLDSMVTQMCGPDPGKYNASQMERDAVAAGSDAAALGDDYAYHAWKEWATEFCNYIEKLQKQPDAKDQLAKMKSDGLRIPGLGGTYLVYSASEAALLLERCPTLKPLLAATV
jgi:hypothetical protein